LVSEPPEFVRVDQNANHLNTPLLDLKRKARPSVVINANHQCQLTVDSPEKEPFSCAVASHQLMDGSSENCWFSSCVVCPKHMTVLERRDRHDYHLWSL
jgi:hypothetical protein